MQKTTIHHLKSATWIATMAVVLLQTPANAFTEATNYLISQHVEQGCGDNNGTYNEDGIYEKDFTGDGKADLIVDDSSLTCQGDETIPQTCGASQCQKTIYVRKGTLLKKAFETYADIQIMPPARLKVYGRHGQTFKILKWNGRTYR